MREVRQRGVALMSAVAVAVALAGCSSAEQPNTTAGTAPVVSPTSEPAAGESTGGNTAKPADSATVESIDTMVAQLKKKKYACKDWKRTDDVEGALASGTCNGEDQIMVFDGPDALQAAREKLDAAGTAYVHGDNWVVANTTTPTFVRNALGGIAVPGGNAS